MKIVFLGTNGWYSDRNGRTVSVFLETSRYNILFDAGDGFSALDKYADFSRKTYLFLSHFHLDHISGLHTLVKYNFRKGLNIIVGRGEKKTIKKILDRPFTFPFFALPYESRISELPGGRNKPPFSVTALPLVHADATFGFRIEIENKIIVYCPDTAFCENAVKLSANADILIAECAFKSGEIKKDWPHLNPELAAEIALKAGAGKLYLTHFDASRYKTLSDRAKAEKAAGKIFPNSFASKDGMIIKI